MVDGRVGMRPAAPDCPSPDATSINNLLRANSRERLYVLPICWTLRQPRLLGCHFTLEKIRWGKGDPPSKSVVQILRDQHPAYKSPIYAIAQLTLPGTLAAKKCDVANILRCYNLFSLGPDSSLSFSFAQREAALLPTDGIFAPPGAPPSLAYITFDFIQTLRKKTVYRPPGGRRNRPVVNLHQKRLRSLEPPNPAEDPYLIAMLIALAQAQRRQADTGERYDGQSTAHRQPRARTASAMDGMVPRAPCLCGPEIGKTIQRAVQSFQVTVLATAGTVTECFYVYTATIPTEFLDRLDAPAQPLRSLPVPVKYFRIPLMPARKALGKLHHLVCNGTCPLCVEEVHAGSGRAD
ncbi:uncharacterized protein BO80DRAFT_441717 [Aspergillus ibericus CBS 121593]|uniref:Uncharacterized protein n=1 Tax=Aspergillus ibericus CBS 121593 TaxID=1448316 RepID=A0A395HBC5_9EURO|nr:hypothetical protein BO80DRAFT_441717 [Aspergillus ibericus CBS 121593]RAL04869.1 hypothetical protein BO80DRAFT_441717 [Aspergillus ibericus CBS 121593]